MSDETARKLIAELEALKKKVERLQVLENGAGGGTGVTDHGDLTGLADDDHPQYVKHSLATAVNDFLVASGAGAFVKKTLAEVKAILGLGSMAYTNVDGWIPVSATWTYASATTITVPSGAAAIYKVGQGIRLTQTTVKYFYIVGVADTVLTITGGSNYTLANAAISAISYTNTPATAIGFPVWFNWTPTQTGWTGVPTGSYRFYLIGKRVECRVVMTAGTSNANNAILTLPITNSAYQSTGTNGYAVDNGTPITVASRWDITANSANLIFLKDMGSTSTSWTTSGTKRVYATVTYEAA